MNTRMFAAVAAALVAALLSLGGASIGIAGQPAGKGADEHASNGNGNAYGHAPEQVAPSPPAAESNPASEEAHGNGHAKGKQRSSQAQKAPSPAPAEQKQAPAPAAKTESGGGSHSTATSGPGSSAQGCDGSHSSNTGHGANHSGPYDNTCDGSPSGNGNGNGKATGKPCAGCVGNADDKNPKGQYPNGSDHNAGYECDRNHGIGRTNPAHTGCKTTETTTETPVVTPPVTDDEKESCPGNGEKLSTALSQAAMVALQAVAAAHPELAKLSELASTTVAGNCSANENQSDNGNGHTPITICHATGSATNPFVEITIDENGLNGHGDHQDDRDIIPAPAEGCPTATTTTTTTTPPVENVIPPVIPPITTVLGTTETGQAPATAPTPGTQEVLGVREEGGTTPSTPKEGENKVLGENASGGAAPAASAPAAARQPVAADEAAGSLPFTGTDAMLVLFLGCLLVLTGVTVQRLTAGRS